MSSLTYPTTYPRLAGWCERIMRWCLYGAIFLVPLFFLPVTMDVLELNKQTLLLFFVFIGLLAWLGQTICLRRFSISRSWLHLVVLVFLCGYLLTALASQDRYISFVGGVGQIPWAFISITAFVFFYILLSAAVRGTALVYHFILTFLISSLFVGAYGILQLVGISPLGFLGDFARLKTFNTIGTVHAFGVYMVVPLIMAASLKVLGCKDAVCVLGRSSKKSTAAHILVWASLFVSLLTAILIDYWIIWFAVLFGTILLAVLAIVRRHRVDHPLKIVVPVVLVIISFAFLVFRTPFHLFLPTEVSPSASASWDIARQTLQERPLVGSGPGTWIFNYSRYRSPAVNLSEFWTARFDRGLSFFLTLLATVGIVGSLLWLVLLVSIVIKSTTYVIRERNDDAWQACLTVFTAWASLAFLAFFYNFSFAHHFVFWFLLGLLAVLLSRSVFVWDIRSVAASSLVSVGYLFVFVGVVSGGWLLVQRLLADVAYVRAITSYQTKKPIQETIGHLVRATRLNPLQDVYYRNLSQAHIAQASQILQEAPDQERVKSVDASVTAALEAAKKTIDISPANVDNWTSFASLFRAIAPFTRGADERAVEMLTEAQKREPTNPEFPNEIGKLYVLRADAYSQLLQSKDETVRKDTEQNVKIELDKAADAFNRSIQSKADFAPAHYNLGLVYERQGRLKDAILKLEQVLRADPRNVGVAFQLAILYYRNNETEKSLDLLTQIANFDPSYVNAHWYLAVIYEQQGKLDEAIRYVEKVAELQPNDQAVFDRLDVLRKAQAAKMQPPPAPLPDPVKEEIQPTLPQSSVKR